MSRKGRIILSTLAGVITTLFIYVAVRLGTGDAAFSIVPGWHTIIYPPRVIGTILAAVILVTSLLVYLLFRGMVKLLTLFWARFKSYD